MTRSTLRHLLTLSLLVNFGTIAAVGWQTLKADGLPMPSGAPTELSRHLQLSTHQLQRWHDIEAPFLAFLHASNAAIGEQRNLLIQTIFDERLDRESIDAEQAKIAELKNDQQILLIDQLLRERDILEPQQREKLAQLLMQQPVGSSTIEQLHRQ